MQTLDKEFHRVKSILSGLAVGATVSDTDYRNIFIHFRDAFTFSSGAESIKLLLERLDVEEEIHRMLNEFDGLRKSQKEKAYKRLRLLINLYTSGVSPSSMILTKIPVLPPDLRPVVQLDGGKFASSDINYFYRRVLMRNLRLTKMIENGMPDVIKKNEIRLLQESVNNLFVGDKSGAK